MTWPRRASGRHGVGRRSPSDVTVWAEGVRKSYPGVEAVRGIDLTVRQGEIFGFLGPNGAGKTTTVSMLCTLARPTVGRIEVAGFDAVRAPAAVRRGIGLVFQQSTLDPRLTAVENLRFHADLYALERAGLSQRVDALLRLVDLGDRSDDQVGTFSGGMRRRLEIARGLLHRPLVLFLDEPTTGLDPHARAQVWAKLREVRAEAGTTLFLTTHYLDEAEHCDRVAILNQGRIVAQGRPSELKALLGADRVYLRTGDDSAAAEALRRRFGLAPVVERAGLTVRVEDGAALVPRLCAGLGVPVHEIAVTRPTLDEVFLHHTGLASGRLDAAPASPGRPR
jgi:ABC-2 type transport system ATP-binding protein